MIVSGIVMRQPERQSLAHLMYEMCEEKFIEKSISPEDAYFFTLQIVDAYINKKNLGELCNTTELDMKFLNELIVECDGIFTEVAIEKARRENCNNTFKFPFISKFFTKRT